MTKDVVMYDGKLTPQVYLEMMTGNYYCLNDDNQVEQVENILDEQFGDGTYHSFALSDISEVQENDHKVVLVECVNIVMKEDRAEQETICRWFEVPEEWTKEHINEKLCKI